MRKRTCLNTAITRLDDTTRKSRVARTVILAALVPFATAQLSAQETITLGAEDGWSSIAASSRVIVQDGRRGFRDVLLEPHFAEPTPRTELLLGFDSLPLVDSARNFAVGPAATASTAALDGPGTELSSAIQRTGRGALLVDGPEDALLLRPTPGSGFTPGREWASFSIGFYLYPASLYDGDTVLRWQATEGAAGGFRTQEVFIGIDGRQLVARFDNFFVTPENEGVVATLTGPEIMVPRRWTHHLIRFDGTTGLLEYLADGVPTDITYVSASGRQDGTVYYPRIAMYPGDGITIAQGFTGALDEVRIEHDFLAEDQQPHLPLDGGFVVSDYIDLGSRAARILDINAVVAEPGYSDVDLYYRISDLQSQNPLEGPEWLPVGGIDSSSSEALEGRFIQLRADLFADTGEGLGPRLSSITVTYEPDPPPLPPARVFAEPGDGTVVLEWAPVLEPDVRGYRVYYGDQPGRYFGNEGAGPSPIDVGPVTSVVLDGLENGRLYYFAVQAYDREDGFRHEMSREVAARPSRAYR